MKTRATSSRPIVVIALAALLPLATSGALAQEGSSNRGIETARDIPGDSNKYYGQRRTQFKDAGRRLAKIDLDADFNYDGVIDNADPADNGAFQQTPPGLVVGVGELSQLIIRVRPYHLDFKGRAVVSLQVDGINRADKSGKFASAEEERSKVGHIKVWRDASRRQLILDSHDPQRQVFEWAIDDSKYPANVPGIVPRTLYVEGVGVSGDYSGDVRLLLKIQHREGGATTTPPPSDGAKSGKGIIFDSGAAESGQESETVTFKRFATSYDHILLTVQGAPRPKEFVNDNTAGVWQKR